MSKVVVKIRNGNQQTFVIDGTKVDSVHVLNDENMVIQQFTLDFEMVDQEKEL